MNQSVTSSKNLTADEAKDVLKIWAGKGLFRQKNLADNLKIDEINTHSFFKVQFNSQYESRQIVTESVAFSGGYIDDKGNEPSLWEIEVVPPSDFEKSSERVKVPHSENVTTCHNCSGSGKVSCSSCGGSGRTTCFGCGGAGRITRYQQKSEYDYYTKQTRYTTETVYETCYSCSGAGQVSCSSCGGNGRQQCRTCEGYGKIKTYKMLSVQFTNRTWTNAVNNSELPNKKLLKSSGKKILDERLPLIQKVKGVHPAISSILNSMATEASSAVENQIRILFQQAIAEEIIGYELSCIWKGKKEKTIWIYGDENQIYIKGIIPFSWWKVTLAILGIVGILSLIAYLIFQT